MSNKPNVRILAPSAKIWDRVRSNGTPSERGILPPFSASKIFNLEVHRAENQTVVIANKKPQTAPEKSEFHSQPKVNWFEPTDANIFSKPILMNQARAKPTNEPTTHDKLATIAK